MIVLDQMISSLPHLSPDDLKAIHDRCAALLSLGSGNGARLAVQRRVTSVEDEFAEMLYSAISDILMERTQIRCMPFRVFMAQQASSKRYREMIAVANAANDKWFPKQSKAERASMIRLYAECIIKHLVSRHLPLTWHSTIPNAVGNLPAIIDRAFPGYAASGMLGQVQALRTKTRQNRPQAESA